MKNFFLILFSLFSVIAAEASFHGPAIVLNENLVVAPLSGTYIEVKKIPKGYPYDITCTISVGFKDSEYASYNLNSVIYNKAMLNEKNVTEGRIYKLERALNDFTLKSAQIQYDSSWFSISNFDADNELKILNCVAYPVLG